LLFVPGERPDRRTIAALAGAGSGFAISLDPADNPGPSAGPDDGGTWLELLANGLTFDLVGLGPGPAAGPPAHGQAFASPAGVEPARMEAITLQPGPHLAGGAAMMPVVRSLAWLAAQLAALPGTVAVAWHPARCWCEASHFRDSVQRWIEGGVFPGLSLASLVPMPDGGMQSQGLALFTGQELRLEPELVPEPAAGAKIALRLMHWLVEQGPLDGPDRLAGPDGQPLRLEPSENRRFIRVWRG
jgi:hypothetical protein